jgi:putative transposase
VYKGYKYRIYPNKEQKELIEKTFGCTRFIYNLALETKNYAYKHFGVNKSGYDLMKELTDLKKEFTWLREVDNKALQQSILNLDQSYKAFFKGNGFPKFKGKNHKQSFVAIQGRMSVDFKGSLISVPKIYNIPAIISREFIGEIRRITISKTPTGKYYASILVETINEKIEPKPVDKAIGIDLGLKEFMITSEGEKVANPRYLRSSIERLKVLQNRAAKKKKGSSNRRKANKRISALHERITNQRIDFLHKLTTNIVHDSQVDTICIENLAVKNMVKNHSLAQAISDVSWGKFNEMLKYKSDWYGKNLIVIDRFSPSSKTCSDCGIINENLKLSDREWICECGIQHDRDINAAINIRNSGLGKSVVPVEMLTLVKSKKQEK